MPEPAGERLPAFGLPSYDLAICSLPEIPARINAVCGFLSARTGRADPGLGPTRSDTPTERVEPLAVAPLGQKSAIWASRRAGPDTPGGPGL